MSTKQRIYKLSLMWRNKYVWQMEKIGSNGWERINIVVKYMVHINITTELKEHWLLVCFWNWTSHQFTYVGACSDESDSNKAATFSNQLLGFASEQPCITANLQSIPIVGICVSWSWSVANIKSASVLSSASRRGTSCYPVVLQPFK